MADFMEQEAVESDSDGSEDMGRKKRPVNSSDEEDEDEDEEAHKEKMQDFLNDDEELSGSDDDRSRKRKKKKRRRRRSGSSGSRSGSGSSGSRSRSGSGSGGRRRRSDDEDLDEDDMDLIEENLGVKIEKKRKRIQMASSDEDGSDGGGARSGSDDDLPDPQRARSRSGSRGGSDEEDIGGFIVDEEGRPIERKKAKRKHIFEDSQRQLAEDIFGVAFDYEEFEEEEEKDETESEYSDEEERPVKEKKKKKSKKTIFDIFDPNDLALGHYTDQDHEIRITDIPERMQLRAVPVTAVPEDSDELDREAEWIYKKGFTEPTLTQQRGYLREECEKWKQKTATVEKIKKALDFMRQQFLEVPFIAFYRKEYVSPELTITDLWRVYYMDEKWAQLQNRKSNVRKLMEKMQTYQSDSLMADPDAPLPEGMKVIDAADFDNLEEVETVEELKDIYDHFLLYHGKRLGACTEFMKKKAREEKEERKRKKRMAKEKKYKVEKKMVTKTVTKTVTRTVTETVTDDDGNEREEEKEVQEEVETDIESEEEVEVTDEEAMAEDDDDDEDPEDADDDEEEDLKHASKADAYSLCVKFGVSGMAARFGLTPEQFGENLRDGYLRNEPEQDPSDVAEVAQEYLSAKLTTTEEVVKAAVFMVATQIAKEPLVRQTVREIFQEKAKVSCRPTEKGVKEIGEDHEIYTMKYLGNKPMREFRHEQFLKLQAAAEEKLVELAIAEDVEGQTPGSALLHEAQEGYKVDAFSKTVENWNKLRADAVEMALTKMIFPALRKEMLHKVRAEAIDGIKAKVKETLYDWIKWAPYSKDFTGSTDDDDDDWDTRDGCRVLGIAYSTEENNKEGSVVASYAVLCTADGELGDFVKMPWLMKNVNSFMPKEREGKQEDMVALRKFIKRKRPHVIAVAAEDMDARSVIRDVEGILDDLKQHEDFPDALEVVLVDNNLAKVYANTPKAKAEFRDMPDILVQAISVARRLQDPLVEFSQLCGPEKDILCLRFHPMQDLVGEENLLEAINLEFINRVTEVGVDINDCVAHPHKSNLIQFVGGLGPRKGANLLKTLRSMPHPRLENRQQLVTSCHMGPKVFINCAGFIKIDTSSLGDSEVYVEVLDGSRIHNEAYEWARKMAVDALEYDEDDGNPASALEDILAQPDKLDELNLDAFAEELERQGFGNKSVTLYDIRDELNSMYKDKRTAYERPNDEEVFNMLTKETPDTFYPGKLCLVTVRNFNYRKPESEELDKAAPVRKGDGEQWQCPFCGQDDFPELTEVWNHFDAVDEEVACRGKCTGVRISYDNGCAGSIHIKDFSDKHVLNPEERVRRGQRIYVRIQKIVPERFSAFAISKSSALVDENWEYRVERDAYYDEKTEKADIEKRKEKKKRETGSTYIRRVIVHPAFQNISFKEAEKLLKDMDQGDAIIRPSSKGNDHLTVTWKVTDEIYQHIDVREEGKTNAFSLGASLWIATEEFEDLDEIIARHINPMAALTRDILGFKYYRADTEGGNRQKCEQMIQAEKRANPAKIHYFFSASKELSGKFMITYMPRDKVRHEFVTVTPDGFRFRKQTFETLGQLMKWFKEHFRDPIPGTPATPGSGGRSTGRTPAITPGAMSMAGAGTPGGFGRSAPYTPTANTPFMTPFNTPGPSVTPRSSGFGGGSGTPRASGNAATPRAGGGGYPGGGVTPGGSTPRVHGRTPGGGPQQSPGGPARPAPKSRGGNMWGDVAADWGGGGGGGGRDRRGGGQHGGGQGGQGERRDRGREGGYNSTPHYDDQRRPPSSSGRTPMGGGRTPSGRSGRDAGTGANTEPLVNPRRTPGGGGVRTPGQLGRDARGTPRGGFGDKGTPRGTPRSGFGDATPLYDE